MFSIELKSEDSPRYGKSFIKYPGLVQHSPHPNRVRHIKTLFGNPVCVVDSEDGNTNRKYSLHFPPNNYDDVKLKTTKLNLHSNSDSNAFVSARPTLDTINSLNYFTGLQSMSFRNRPNFNMSRVKSLEGWEKQLKNITDSALDPFLKNKCLSENQLTMIETGRDSISSPMKRMYSSSGRILPIIGISRPLTSPEKRPNSRLNSSKSFMSEGGSNDINIDLQVFHLLGGILQTNENEVIKTWLLTATEREKALMVDIVRCALVDKEELNIFVRDSIPNGENQIIYTPAKNFSSKLPVISENSNSEKIDQLVIHSDPQPKFEVPPTRPPTSSTFRPNTRISTARPQTRGQSSWMQSESIVVN